MKKSLFLATVFMKAGLSSFANDEILPGNFSSVHINETQILKVL